MVNDIHAYNYINITLKYDKYVRFIAISYGVLENSMSCGIISTTSKHINLRTLLKNILTISLEC